MKKFIILILSVLVCSITNAQDNTTVEVFSISTITDSVRLFISSVNWLYVLVFMLVTWLFNDATDAVNVPTWPAWLSKINRAVRALLIGIALVIAYAYFFKLYARQDIFKLFLSLITAMVIYKFGIDKIFRYLSNRLGLKFE